MASKAKPKVYRVHFAPRLEAVLPSFTREEREELVKAAAALLDEAVTLAQGGSGEHDITSKWACLSFGRVGLAIFLDEIVIMFDGPIPEGPDDRPPGVSPLAASELTDALRASARQNISPAALTVPAKFMVFIPSSGDSNGSDVLKSQEKVKVISRALKSARGTPFTGALCLSPEIRKDDSVVSGTVYTSLTGVCRCVCLEFMKQVSVLF